jgi:hypothetical protein
VHHPDVVDVLARDFGDRDVEDVEVLAADQVKQQVERPFERFEDDLERVRRDVEILRHLQDRLSHHHRQRHFLLLRLVRHMLGGRGSGVGRQLVAHGVTAPSGPVARCVASRVPKA